MSIPKNIRLKQDTIVSIAKMVIKTGNTQRRDYTYENRILYTFTQSAELSPSECADIVFDSYGQRETGHSVISILKVCGLVPQERRTSILKDAEEIADRIIRLLADNLSATPADIEKLEKKISSHKDSSILKRLVLHQIYSKVSPLNQGKSFEYMMRLSRIFAGECVDSIITILKIQLGSIAGTEDYEKEIFRLESELERSNRLLLRLQDEFEDRIEYNRKEECENLISLLNSSKYGYILDMLTNLQSGMKKLRKAGKMIPLEIGSLPSLARQLLQFVEDCGITPIMDIGEEFTVKACDIANYHYQGSPFKEADDEKYVIVTSTGWEIKDKELIVSLPAVQEKE